GESYITVEGKYCFGAGMRLNYLMNKRISAFSGLMIVDRGYKLHFYGDTDTGPVDTRLNYRLIYLSIPLGIIMNISEELHPYYLVSGFLTDIMLDKLRYLNRFNGSILLGAGKGFNLGRSLVVTVEPNIKIPITNYGDLHLLYEFYEYKPYSMGLNIGISW
ncbi:hypothetical protein LCGC14_2854590, partial [marine sediment metagenome]